MVRILSSIYKSGFQGGDEILFRDKDGEERVEVLHILQFPEKKRQDSFWFDGVVARLGRYELVACGDLECKFAGDSNWYRDGNAVERAYARKLNDDSLYLTEKNGVVEWDNNNWFEVVGESGECVIGDVDHTFDEGIRSLIHFYEEDSLGEYEERG